MANVQRYKTLRGYQVSLTDPPLGWGGEGTIHHISNSSHYPVHCAKLFKENPSKSAADIRNRGYRIKFMILNPPATSQAEKIRLCWPVDALVRGNDIVGFIMPLAFNDSIKLYELCQPKMRKRLPSIWHTKYDRSTKEGLTARLKLCTNIAVAIHQLHTKANSVIVDMKPPNILVSPGGQVSMIDCDSLQITKDGKVYFRASVATEEYVPPEARNINMNTNTIRPSWDLFSMAVIMYQVLFGIHPYAVTFRGQNDTNGTRTHRIRKGYFAHGQKRASLTVIPEPHNRFNHIPDQIKELFVRAFDAQSHMPDTRPTAEEWGKTLYQYSQRPTSLNPRLVQGAQSTRSVGATAPRRKSGQPHVAHGQQATSWVNEPWAKITVAYILWIIILTALTTAG